MKHELCKCIEYWLASIVALHGPTYQRAGPGRILISISLGTVMKILPANIYLPIGQEMKTLPGYNIQA